MTTLELTNITRCFERGVAVLDEVSLSLAPGEVLGLLGRNGAGKTTLIKIALGMLQPQEGEVRLFGLDPARHSVEVKRRVGYVSEEQLLPPYLRVKDVLEMHRQLFPTWDVQLERDLSERFELGMREKLSKLSKGQARRVGVLCAIAHRPELLLLDEPASGLDPAARREFLETALELLADEGSAILFSSHQMDDVERIASRVCLLEGARVLIDAELDTLRERATLATLSATNGVSQDQLRAVPGCLSARVVEDELRALFVCGAERARQNVAALGHGASEHAAALRPISLEDLFIEIAEGRR